MAAQVEFGLLGGLEQIRRSRHFARAREAGDHSQSRRSGAGRPPNRDPSRIAGQPAAAVRAGRGFRRRTRRLHRRRPRPGGHLGRRDHRPPPADRHRRPAAGRDQEHGRTRKPPRTRDRRRRLIQAAIDLAAAESVTTILVATAAADIGNLRFYQRQGFRMRSVERDAFTPATGYPPGLLIEGIELRDRVWLDRVVLARGHAVLC